MSRRHFCPSLERCDVGSQRRDVGFNHSLERRDVESQRRDVGCFTLWNVATLHSHVVMLPLFKAKIHHILILPPFPPCLNPTAPHCRHHHTHTHTLAGIHSHTCRRPLFHPPTTSPPLPPPFFHHTDHSPVPISCFPHHALVPSILLGLVLHIRSRLSRQVL